MKPITVAGKERQGRILVINAVLLAIAAVIIGLLLARGGPGPNPQPLLIGVPWAFTGVIEAVEAAPTAAQEGLALQAVMAAGPNLSEAAQVFESFVQDNPASAWTPALRAELARFHLEEGSYTKALAHWQAAWDATKQYPAGPGKRVADNVFVQWTRALVGLGRLEELDLMFAENRDRVPGIITLRQKLLDTRDRHQFLRISPGSSYRCGWQVLDKLSASVRNQRLDPALASGLYQEQNLFQSCSMKTIADLAQRTQWSLIGVERPEGSLELPVPSIIHLKQAHYIALLREEEGYIAAYDPLFGMRRFRPDVLNFETSGRFLVSSGQVPLGWRRLTSDEMITTVGRCDENYLHDRKENYCENCPELCPFGAGGTGGSSHGGSHGSSGGNMGGPGGNTGNGQNQGCAAEGHCGGSPPPPSLPPSYIDRAAGMPHWSVSEPNINLWLVDTPITCQGAYGPPVPFKLQRKQRDTDFGNSRSVFGFGPTWSSPWLSCADFGRYEGSREVSILAPGGGVIQFSFALGQTVAWDYDYNSRLTVTLDGNGNPIATLDYPDGRRYVYEYLWGTTYRYLTQADDRQGFVTKFNYTVETVGGITGLRLNTVTDQADQLLYQVGYGPYYSTNLYPHLVTSVTNRFGQTARMTYVNQDLSPLLQTIQDAAGMSSSIDYLTDGWPSHLYTPYGTTTFELYGGPFAYVDFYRVAQVTEPNGGRQIFVFTANSAQLWSGNPWLPASLPAGLVPSNLPAGTTLETNTLDRLNSFHWDQNQAAHLTSGFLDYTGLSAVTPNDMQLARMRHWLNGGGIAPDFALSLETAPSQDDAGESLGQVTWFDNAGKPQDQNGEPGTQIQPSLIARKLPDGSTWYQSFARNSFGLPTAVISTYGTGDPAQTRTNTFVYDSNSQDLIEIYRPGNDLVAEFTYNSGHQMLTQKLHPDASTTYQTTWVYDTQGRLQTLTTPAGITSTYSYSAPCNGYAGYLSQIADSPIVRTQSFTWLNGNIRTHTDYRGLQRTYTFDGLNRVTEIDFPEHDGIAASSIQYSYLLQNGRGFNNSGQDIPILEVTAVKDRRDKWTYYERDELGRLSKSVDPLNHSTTYHYCGCGGPDSITDARNKTTTFLYNNAGWKTSVVYPDNTWETYGYDPLGRITNRTDSLGSRLYTYNNQGLLNGIVSAYGTERSATYNIHDQPTTVVDANGVSVTQDFDWLGQMLHRTVPGQNQEVFQYSARGLTDYWGPDTEHTQYGYDEALRKTSEVTPKNETIGYAYNGAGDLLTLADGRNKVTTWTNDIEGLVQAKKYHGQTFANITYSYDANQRLAWRKFWSSPTVSAQTSYGYDDAGNLLSIDYPTSPDVSFTYNENNQPLTMTTAGLGTITNTYTDAGNLWTEGGLWANDTVTNTYHTSVPHLRTGLTLTQPALSWAQSYSYDAADRLQTVTSPAGTFTYTYLGPGTLWTNLGLPSTSVITNAYDSGGRLTRTALRTSANAVLNSHDYLYNTAGQRQRQTLTDASYTVYGYDDDAQLNSSLGYTSGGTPITSEQLGFGYDAGWNMTTRSVNGTLANYTINDLNQVTNAASVPCTYDQNGNRTTYGQGSGTTQYTYDDENRLTRVSYSTAYRTDFAYDGSGRLRVRTEYTWYNYAWNVSSVTRYIYDGKRVIQERDGNNNNPLVAYSRGKDLSGSLEGAGGIGGLLARSHGYNSGSWSTHNLYHADALGNVTYMLDSSQAMVASYKYDPYGRTISSSGSLAAANLYRFSSKELHVNSGFYYYLYRFYDPNTQRWLNRDPLDESADLNLYGFVVNNPAAYCDLFGFDRYLYFFLHMWIGVDEYDEHGNVIGQLYLNFAPEGLWGNHDPGEPLSPDYTVLKPSDFPSFYVPCMVRKKKSSRKDDEGLVMRWQQARHDPRFRRWSLLYNCWTCSFKNFSANAPLPPTILLPPYSGGPINAPPPIRLILK